MFESVRKIWNNDHYYGHYLTQLPSKLWKFAQNDDLTFYPKDGKVLETCYGGLAESRMITKIESSGSGIFAGASSGERRTNFIFMKYLEIAFRRVVGSCFAAVSLSTAALGFAIKVIQHLAYSFKSPAEIISDETVLSSNEVISEEDETSFSSSEGISEEDETVLSPDEIISDATVLWAREKYFIGRRYLNASNEKIKTLIKTNPPPPLYRKYGTNLLGHAIRDLRVKTVKELLAVGFNPNQRDLDKLLPFHSASHLWKIETEEHFEQFKEILKALLEAGFDLNQDSSLTYHLGYLGKPSGRPYDVFAYCVEQGLNINRRDPKTGNTHIHEILELSSDANARWIDYLLQLGADPTIPNEKGETPMSIASGRNLPETLAVFRKWNDQV